MIRRTLALLPAVLLLASCAHLLPRGPDAREREELWARGHWAARADSFPAAMRHFGTLAERHPASWEGREARLVMAALLLDPANADWSADEAVRQVRLYLTADSAAHPHRPRRAEAEALLGLARQFTLTCEERIAPLRCRTEVVTVPAPDGEAPPPPPSNGASEAEVARLQAIIAERDEQIRRLRAELERIRNTLVPQRP